MEFKEDVRVVATLADGSQVLESSVRKAGAAMIAHAQRMRDQLMRRYQPIDTTCEVVA